ncbi:alpha/beta fold hydrolase [soil metagenome]
MLGRRNFIQMSALAIAATQIPALAQRSLPKSEFDYVDWSWQRWREMTGEQRPRLRSEQTGKAELVELLTERGGRTNSKGEWETRRAGIRKIISTILGEAPASKPPLAPLTTTETSREGYALRELSFQTEPGERVPSLLLKPKNVRGRVPVVVCPHQTTQEGKREPAGLAGKPEMQTALHLVKRGYATFTYDALCFGERHDPASGHYGDAIPFYRRHPRWSLIGKMIWDLRRALDYLETLDFIDSSRVGCIGHSHGGITTLFAMAFEERVKVGASNCGFDTFRIDGNVWRWSHATALMPRLGFYVGSPHINMDFYRAVPDSEVIQTPFDMHELLALIAPRPLFLSTSDDDFVFPNAGWSARRSLARLKPVYSLLNGAGNIEGHFFNGGHNFPNEVSSRAYEWLDRWLKP